jgi:predicted unusual protein kinase regulating ubiquinone biosynthesis (AarF/ABC1/UbiB family)
LSPSRQDQLLKLLLAVSEANGDRAATLALQIGQPMPDVDEAALRHDIQAIVSGYHDTALDELQVGRVVMEISRTAGRHGIRLPPELTLLGKTLLNLDQVGRTLAPDFDVNGALREEGPALMQERMTRSVSPANVLAAALETKEFLEQLPGRVNKFLDVATNNQLKLNVEVVDEGAVIHGLQKVANRITLGLLLASLIIGAAMLMRVETRFRLFGYPGFAMLFFLAAAAGAAWLAFSIVSTDRPPRGRGR